MARKVVSLLAATLWHWRAPTSILTYVQSTLGARWRKARLGTRRYTWVCAPTANAPRHRLAASGHPPKGCGHEPYAGPKI